MLLLIPNHFFPNRDKKGCTAVLSMHNFIFIYPTSFRNTEENVNRTREQPAESDEEENTANIHVMQEQEEQEEDIPLMLQDDTEDNEDSS